MAEPSASDPAVVSTVSTSPVSKFERAKAEAIELIERGGAAALSGASRVNFQILFFFFFKKKEKIFLRFSLLLLILPSFI